MTAFGGVSRVLTLSATEASMLAGQTMRELARIGDDIGRIGVGLHSSPLNTVTTAMESGTGVGSRLLALRADLSHVIAGGEALAGTGHTAGLGMRQVIDGAKAIGRNLDDSVMPWARDMDDAVKSADITRVLRLTTQAREPAFAMQQARAAMNLLDEADDLRKLGVTEFLTDKGIATHRSVLEALRIPLP